MSKLLKKCPFCGSSAKIVPNTFGDGGSAYYRVECEEGHSLDQWDETSQEAGDAWNKRVKLKQLRG